MKVILEAFQGKLRSEPMDWPDDTGYDIRMLMDTEYSNYYDHAIDPTKTVCRSVRFVATDKHVILPDSSQTAQIYKLVDF